MEAHALELLHLSIWVVIGLGGIGISTFTWGGKQILKRLDSLESLLRSELQAIREDHHSLDKRVIRIEERCEVILQPPTSNHVHKP